MTQLIPSRSKDNTPSENAPSTDTAMKNRVAFLGTILQAIVLLILAAASLYIAMSGFYLALSPASYAGIVGLILTFAGISILLNIASLITTFRQRQGLGYRLTFFAMLVFALGVIFLIQGRGLFISFFLLVVSSIGIGWLCPPQEKRFYTIITAMAFGVIWIIEWINPTWRLTYSGAQLGPAAAIIFGAVLFGIIILQAWNLGKINFGIRLTLLTLIAALPILGIAMYFLVAQAGNIIETQANQQLEKTNQTMSGNVQIWLNQQSETLKTLVTMPAITSMDAVTQEPVLKAFQNGHPNIYLVHTINTAGFNIARSDGGKLTDYKDRDYFVKSIAGTPIVFQSLIGRTSNKPAVCMGAPIQNETGAIVGVGSLCSTLTEVTRSADVAKVGQTGFAFIVDDKNQVVAHPNPEYTTGKLNDFSQYPPVAMLRNGQKGLVTFTDKNGEAWHAYIEALDNGWGVITQQKDSEYLATLSGFRTISIIATLVVALVTAGALWLIVQQGVRPILTLTRIAQAISSGDLGQTASEDRTDEFGILAKAFNSMTFSLHESIATLETRVADRTQSLELAVRVGRAVSQVRAMDAMLKDATELIRSQFDLYYVQVYLTDPSFTNLILMSGTGEVGAQLVERAHSLPLNANSINGRAAIEKRSIVVEDTAQSPTFKPNPLLPLTQSEIAIPLMVGEKVVGVLDLQSEQTQALNTDILSAFEAMAGQLGIAIQNSKLLDEAEQARAEVEKQARRLVRAGWQDYLDAVHKPELTSFVYEGNQVKQVSKDQSVEWPAELPTITAPIAVSGEPVGTLAVGLDFQDQSPQATELVNIVARQVAQQIENLRLLESAERYRAEAEQANRLATIEGWKKYTNERAAENLSYLYDMREVKAYKPEDEHQLGEKVATLPLKVHDETIGKIAITGIDENDTEALFLASEVAERLSAHIESIRQFAETKQNQLELDQRARQLAAVAEVSTVSSRELDIQKMLESVVFLTQRRFNLYHAHIFTYDKHTDNLVIAACGWQEGSEQKGTHGTTTIPRSTEQSLVARAARSLDVVIVNDVHTDPGWLPNPLLPDTASEMAVPLVIGEQILGVLDVQSDQLNAFSKEDASIYTTLASQVATALQNAQSFARAQQQAEREAKLNAISQKIQSATTVEAVLQIAARELGHALGAPRTIAQLSLKDKK